MKWHFWLHPLRGFAAIMVVFLHSYWTWSFFDSYLTRKLYLMVDLFFVLSGFVISSGYIDRVKDFTSFVSFLRRRVDRLWFQYFSSGLIWLVAAIAMGGYVNILQIAASIVRYMSLTDFLFVGNIPRINPVTWSVMTEVWVYISFGLLAIIISQRHVATPILLATAAIATVYLGLFYHNLNLVVGVGPLARAFAGFFAGSMCYRARFITHKTGYFSILIVFNIIISALGGNADLLIIPISSVVIFLISNLNGPKNTYLAKCMQWLGEISFPLYVWHFLISVVLAKIAHKAFGGQFVIYNGEKFLHVSPLIGNILCLILISLSLAVAQTSIYAEALITRRKHR